MSDNRFYVYEHMRPDTGHPFYVGKGSGVRARISNRHHRNQHWMRIVHKCGSFEIKFVAIGIDEELAFLVEIERIAQLKALGFSLCNQTIGGDGISGLIRTQEWRKKIGDAHRGKLKSNETKARLSIAVRLCGYTPSPEARAKMSAAHKGQKRSLGYRHTDEWKAKQSIWIAGNRSRTGQKRSAEERQKSSVALSGRKQKEIECPRCGAIGGNAMKRWHFDNCRKE